jgi:hypothetical protein
MKTTALILLFTAALVLAAGSALAECDCRQPAYKDQMDFVTRYTACLDDCLNAEIQQIRLENRATARRVSDLEAEVERLNRSLYNLQAGQTSEKNAQ